MVAIQQQRLPKKRIEMTKESSQSNILDWLRGHMIVVDPTAMVELRQSLKKVSDLKKMHRAMHANAMEWEIRKDEELPNLHLADELDMLCVVHPLTEDETNRKAMLLIQHRLAFPSKLCSSIEQALTNNQNKHGELSDASNFLAQVYEEVKAFFIGRHRDIVAEHRTRILPEEWLGLDWNVDTEDEIEAAIRFFPLVLTEYLHSTLAILSPIQLLLAREQTVSFVPILAQLLTEAGNFLERQFVVKYGLRNILELLMTNCFPKIVFGYDVSESFDNESLSVLARLREMGLVENEEVRILITSLMTYALESDMLKRDNQFVETRLRLLIGWNPSVLEQGRRPLLHTIYGESMSHSCDDSMLLCMFETLVELGMAHYSKQLGFVFHKWGGILPLESFASSFGTERVTEIVNQKLSTKFGSSSMALSSLIIEAATNDKIHLDGVYRLISLNPIICSKTSKG